MIRLLWFLMVGITLLLFPPNLTARTYYVALSGDDASNGLAAAHEGGLSGPFKTIGRGVRALNAGDTLYVRSGVYHEQVVVSASGSQSLPILIASFPEEWAVVDGRDTLPASTWGTLFQVTGSNVIIRDMEVRNSKWIGVEITGSYSQALNIHSHHHMEHGLLLRADYTLAARCKIWWNAKRNESGLAYPKGGWATGISAGRYSRHATIRDCIVWNNWGEGVSTFESENTTIEDNVVYDNQTNIYISDTINTLCQRNLVYSTPNNPLTKSYGRQTGIMMGDELYKPASANNTIVNNVVAGNKHNFYWWQGTNGGGLVNTRIAHNTFVNSVDTANLEISAGSHSGTLVANNILLQEGTLPAAVIPSSAGLSFAGNLLSKSSAVAALNASAVVANPGLSKHGEMIPGSLTAAYFRLTAASPARDAAVALDFVREDFFRSARGVRPDIGAHEYTDGGTMQPPTNLRLR